MKNNKEIIGLTMLSVFYLALVRIGDLITPCILDFDFIVRLVCLDAPGIEVSFLLLFFLNAIGVRVSMSFEVVFGFSCTTGI